MAIITLKNGKKIELEWSFLVMQYLEDYEGGLKQLKIDMKQKKNLLKIESLFIYAAVRANYDEKLGYQEAIRLVKMEDINTINKFFEENLRTQNDFKKRPEIYTTKEIEKIDWATIKYTAITIGLSIDELMHLNPVEFYRMVDMYIKMQRKKYGK